MDVDLIREGRSFTIYTLIYGDRHDLSALLQDLKQSGSNELSKIVCRLDNLAEYGSTRNRTLYNSLGDGLFEAKTYGGTRAIFFYERGRLVICTSGFKKKRGRTPPMQITRAKKRRDDFRSARINGLLSLTLEPGQSQPRRML